MLDEQLTTRRRLSRARVFTVGALSALTAAGTGFGLVALAAPGDPPGTIRTIAGVTTNYRQGGFSGDGGKAVDAQLYNPRAVAFSKSGDVYIGDALNHRIRKIDKDGVITTVAGKPANTSTSGSPTGALTSRTSRTWCRWSGRDRSASRWTPRNRFCVGARAWWCSPRGRAR